MGYAQRTNTPSHRVFVIGQLLLTRVPVVPGDPFVNTFRAQSEGWWYEGRVFRLPFWTRVRTGLALAVPRDVTTLRWVIGRAVVELTIVALALWLLVS